jgi:hypothetical protein
LTPDDVQVTQAGTIVTPGAIASFDNQHGNFKFTHPYANHTRSISDYTNLAIVKQEETILKTNGSVSAREKYSAPASIQCLTQAITQTSELSGVAVYSIHFVFSGQRGPNIQQVIAEDP